MEKRKNKIIVILGPTSSGKSEVAIKLAKKLALSKVEGLDGAEIISADSRQIYRGMNVGTGKVEPDRPGEIPVKFAKSKFSSGSHPFISGGIPHYMLDIVSPKTDYNVAKFKKQADKIIADILRRGKLPIICGGTGFWIKAVVDNANFPKVKPDKALRRKYDVLSANKLYNILKKIDFQRARSIDRNNKVRLIRAIEICKVLGKVPTNNLRPATYNFLQIGINVRKKKLQENIKKRLEKRFQQDMIKEVKDLREKHKLSWKKIQSFGLGYYWIPLYLQNKLDKKELFEKIYQAEKDYAKRQMTWFQKDKRIKWLKNYREIEKETKKFVS